MRSYQRCFFWVAALAIAAWTSPRALVLAENTSPLKLVKTIELADIRSGEPDVSADQLAKNLTTTRMVGVQNHFDHLTADLKNNRLFVVPEDHKTIEVYDLRTGKFKFVHSIKGIGVGLEYRQIQWSRVESSIRFLLSQPGTAFFRAD
jgi:hypothetical protein